METQDKMNEAKVFMQQHGLVCKNCHYRKWAQKSADVLKCMFPDREMNQLSLDFCSDFQPRKPKEIRNGQS